MPHRCTRTCDCPAARDARDQERAERIAARRGDRWLVGLLAAVLVIAGGAAAALNWWLA